MQNSGITLTVICIINVAHHPCTENWSQEHLNEIKKEKKTWQRSAVNFRNAREKTNHKQHERASP